MAPRRKTPDPQRAGYQPELYEDRWSPVLLILLNVIALTGLAMSLYRERFVTGVHLKQVHETPGLWQKYGEKLVLLVLGAAIALLSKWIGDSWLAR